MQNNLETRSVLVCIWVVAACGCASPPEFVYAKRMGLAKWNENRGCLSVFNSSITPGTKVALVDQPASTDPPSVKDATVVERLAQICDEALSLSDNDGVLPSFYQVTTADGSTPSTRVMFAILDPPGSIVVRDGLVEADLDGDETKESFRVCHSTETVHFMVWTGFPAEGHPRWRRWHTVDYGMGPTCTDQEVAGMVALDKRRTSVK